MYNNPKLYDDIMWWKKDDIDFWLSIIKRKKSIKILELCCGTGRIGLPLINAGLDYYGIDLSEEFVNEANRMLKHHNLSSSGEVIYGDMSSLIVFLYV